MYIMPLVATLLMGCGPGGSSFRIKGKFSDMMGGELYLYNISEQHASFDTITISSGEFRFEGEVSEPTPYMLVFPNAMEQVIFVSPGKEITYEVSSTDLKNYVVKGTDENKVMNEFRESVSANPAKKLDIVRKYIEDYRESIIAIYLFDAYYVRNTNVSTEEIGKILAILKKTHPNNDYLLNIEGKLKTTDKYKVGKVVADIPLRNSSNETSMLWDKKTEGNILIYFWATWANGYYDYLWKVRDHARSMEDKERCRFVGICLDTDMTRFTNDTRTDEGIECIEQYCDGLGLESPTFKKLGIPNIPYYLIVDKNHKIIAFGKEADQMVKDMRKHIAGK